MKFSNSLITKTTSLFLTAVLLLYSLTPPSSLAFAAAPTEKEIRINLNKEESKAKSRQASLKLLTEQERALDIELAELEKRIIGLEQQLAKQHDALVSLLKNDDSLRGEYEKILAEKHRTEGSLREVLRTLWELQSKLESVGGRDLEEWPVTDRQYWWATELFKSIHKYHNKLEEQRLQLEDVVARREAVSKDINQKIALVEREKTSLLSDRIKYEQRLAVTRKEKRSAEAELNATLKLIDDLNFDLQSAKVVSADIGKAKGKLLRPVIGRMSVRYKPTATPPIQGVGFSASVSTEVRAVHGGKVMFNDTMRGLGQVVVLQHGSDYFTVYAFLAESGVKMGQNVTRGERIGSSGYYPVIKDSGLYFELRYHQKAINPEPWFEAAK